MKKTTISLPIYGNGVFTENDMDSAANIGLPYVTSYVPDNSYNQPTKFVSGLGYMIDSPSIDFIISETNILHIMNEDDREIDHDSTNIRQICTSDMVPSCDVTPIGILRMTQAVNYMEKYVLKKNNVVRKKKSSINNIPKSKNNAVESVRMFCKQAVSPQWYESMVSTSSTSSINSILKPWFQRIAFQQQLFLESIVTVGNMYGLSMYMGELLHGWKHIYDFGIEELTLKECEKVVRRLSEEHSIYIVPRQSGKSSFTKPILGLLLNMTPGANARVAYICLSKKHTTTVYESLVNTICEFSRIFNDESIKTYREKEQCFLNENGQYSDTEVFYKSEFSRTAIEYRIKVTYSKWKLYRETTSYGSYVDKEIRVEGQTTTSFRCIIYNQSDAVRGCDFNLVFVDEANFLKPEFFHEFLPIVSKVGCKTIYLSSDKTFDRTKDTIDVGLKRVPGKIVNAIGFCCIEHCVAICDSSTGESACPCKMASQSVNNKMDVKSRALIDSFTAGEDKYGEDGIGIEDEIKNTNTCLLKSEMKTEYGRQLARFSMLREFGILPTGVDIKKLIELCNIHKDTSEMYGCIVPQHAYNTFATKSFDLPKAIKEQLLYEHNMSNIPPPRYHVMRTVYAYLDPSGTERSASRNALSFVCIVIDNECDISKNPPVIGTSTETEGWFTVILSVDEFHTGFFGDFYGIMTDYQEITDYEYKNFKRHDFESNPDIVRAMFSVRSIHMISIVYNFFFDRFIFIPETSAAIMFTMWWKYFGQLFFYDPKYQGYGNIPSLSSVIDINSTQVESSARKRLGKYAYGAVKQFDSGEGGYDPSTKYKRNYKNMTNIGVDDLDDLTYDEQYEHLVKRTKKALKKTNTDDISYWYSLMGDIRVRKMMESRPDILGQWIQEAEAENVARDAVIWKERTTKQLNNNPVTHTYIGYDLGSEKTSYCIQWLNLFRVGRVMLSSHVFSLSYHVKQRHMYNYDISPIISAEARVNTDVLDPNNGTTLCGWLINKIKYFKPIYKTGSKHVYFSGKTELNGEMITDDALISLIMGTMISFYNEHACYQKKKFLSLCTLEKLPEPDMLNIEEMTEKYTVF